MRLLHQVRAGPGGLREGKRQLVGDVLAHPERGVEQRQRGDVQPLLSFQLGDHGLPELDRLQPLTMPGQHVSGCGQLGHKRIVYLF